MNRVVALLFLFCGVARADEHPDARNTSIDANPYHLAASGAGLLTIGSARVLNPFDYRISAVYQALRDPIVIESTSTEDRRALVGMRSQLDLAVAVGLPHRIELDVLWPVVLHQDAELPGFGLGPVAAFGSGDPIIEARVTALSTPGVDLGFSLPTTIPIGKDEAYMGIVGPSVEPRLVASAHDQDGITATARIGFRIQSTTTLFNVTDASKLTFALGAGVEREDWALGAELTGAMRAAALFANAGETSAEIGFGARRQISVVWSAVAAFGVGTATGIPTPRWRASVGVTYTAPETDPDPDMDAVRRRADSCPSEAEDVDGFEDEDGCPEAGASIDHEAAAAAEVEEGTETPVETATDTDGDGIADDADACRDEREDMDGHGDEDGCPEDELRSIPNRLLFELGQSNFRPEDLVELDRVVVLLEQFPEARVRIEGHADDIGSAPENMRLSSLRAQAVLSYLTAKSPELAGRLEAVGLGETQPIASNDTPEGRAENRCVVFTVLSR